MSCRIFEKRGKWCYIDDKGVLHKRYTKEELLEEFYPESQEIEEETEDE